MRLLFVVEDRFQVTHIGCVVTPGVGADGPIVRSGDEVLLRRPDGSVIRTVANLELISGRERPEAERPIPISLRGLTKDDVPVGTEVFLAEESE